MRHERKEIRDKVHGKRNKNATGVYTNDFGHLAVEKRIIRSCCSRVIHE